MIFRELDQYTVILYRVITVEKTYYCLSTWEDSGQKQKNKHRGKSFLNNKWLSEVRCRLPKKAKAHREAEVKDYNKLSLNLSQKAFPELKNGVVDGGRLLFDEQYITDQLIT